MRTHKGHKESSKCWQKLDAPAAEYTTDETKHPVSFVHLGVDVLIETSVTSDENTKVTPSLCSILLATIQKKNTTKLYLSSLKGPC